ncbi:sulfatase [Flavobacterium sp. UMI-01]|uniref:sulfatase n=1 Tax=Flavobacterium sp. UMI-01 TaxID=1441053 RepID=UPI001C7DB553|nr:sulfatase [Flavobacterium sp. UMI-01]GIZ09717.1 aryl-sulfate sulfohydrolase [Flavobacterium sp. UMI-01]
MQKIHHIVLILLLSISTSYSQANKPNVIYINVDDLGWMDTVTYGSRFYETPHIDQLAKSGMRFTQGYAAAANCAPSRACLMSGQNTPRHGIYTVGNSERGNAKTRKLIPIENNEILADSVLTMAEMFKQQGYVTGTFGKWHLGKNPKTQGFDVNYGGGHQGAPGNGGYFSPYNLPSLENGPDGENLTDRLTQETIRFISENKDKPFFVYLPFYAVHTRLETTAELEKKYSKKGGDKLQNNAVYAGMIETVDKNIGLLMNALESLHLDNTLIVFTSDNGGIRKISSQHPLRAGKGSYYEGGIRVPYIIRWKGIVAPNTVSETPITNLDFYPTFMDMLKLKLPNKKLDGTSILAVLKGEKIKERPLFFHFPIYLEAYDSEKDDARDPLFRTRPGSVIIEGNWKLHQYFEDNALELYNLETDLGERHNLVKANPQKAKELLAKLDNWRKTIQAPIPTNRNPAYDATYKPLKNKKGKEQ